MSFLHKKKNILYLTCVQLDEETNEIKAYKVYENLKNDNSLVVLSVQEPYLLYMSKAKIPANQPIWPGWVIFSSKYIQFIHDSKYDLFEIHFDNHDKNIVYVCKLSETNFTIFMDTGEVYLVAIESRINLTE